MSPTGKRIADLIRYGSDHTLRKNLEEIRDHFKKVGNWSAENIARTNENLALQNLIQAAASYLNVAAGGADTHISVLALSTRCMYELDLRARFVLSSQDAMHSWQAEIATDKIQVLEGILQIDSPPEADDSRELIRAEISRINAVIEKHQMPKVEKIPSSAYIAKSVGQTDEHKIFFKLFSKLVHPSSYVVNDYSNAAAPEVREILLIQLQLYAWDLFSRVCDVLKVPDDMRQITVGEDESSASP